MRVGAETATDTGKRPVIELADVTKVYQLGEVEVRALRGVSLHIEEGEYVAIVGPSGSGKSTLMNIIGCLDQPTAGSYRLAGAEVADLEDDQLAEIRNRRIGFVFQTFNLLARTTALGNVELPMIYNGSDQRHKKAVAALESVGLGDRTHHHPNELSGGQQQRVAIARALVNEPAIILADEPTGNLDSKSGQEIMDTFDRLNQQGLTVIVVTHDPNVAARTQRIIHLFDGRIVDDERVRERSPLRQVSRASLSMDQRTGGMSPTESLRVALRSLRANKMRSFLTVLGIVIGVTAVIGMLAFGRATREAMMAQIQQIGTDLIFVQPGSTTRGGARTEAGTAITLTDGDAEAIASLIPPPLVVNVVPEVTTSEQVVYAGANMNTRITGTTPAYEDARSFYTDQGVFFTQEDLAAHRPVAVLGKTVVDELFGDVDPIGETIRIRNAPFRVIGVMEEKGGSAFANQDEVVLVPLTTAKTRLSDRTRYRGQYSVSVINIQTSDTAYMDRVMEEVTRILRERHDLGISDEDDFALLSQQEVLDVANEMMSIFTAFMGGVAGISLIVGGIGIMNIMLVSVTERTREIGIRKAVGARRQDILSQFLTEATVLSLCGGMLGVALGFIFARAARGADMGGYVLEPTIGLDSILVATLFSMAVGLFFGIYPARRAAALHPIDALRYE
ncbi:MAG: ABC transporter permease [Anaerolineae bacterium]